MEISFKQVNFAQNEGFCRISQKITPSVPFNYFTVKKATKYQKSSFAPFDFEERILILPQQIKEVYMIYFGPFLLNNAYELTKIV